MAFFADIGCDYLMVDSANPNSGKNLKNFKNSKNARNPNNPSGDSRIMRDIFAKFGAGIAKSSNPNMVFGACNSGNGHPSGAVEVEL